MKFVPEIVMIYECSVLNLLNEGTWLLKIMFLWVSHYTKSSVDRGVYKTTLIGNTNVLHKSVHRFCQEFSENLQFGQPF